MNGFVSSQTAGYFLFLLAPHFLLQIIKRGHVWLALYSLTLWNRAQ